MAELQKKGVSELWKEGVRKGGCWGKMELGKEGARELWKEGGRVMEGGS